MSEAFSEHFDFSRLAPRQGAAAPAPATRLVWDNPDPPNPDELARLGKLIRTSIGLAWACARIYAAILRHRIWGWFERRILHSLHVAWVAAASGWAFSLVGIPVTIYLLT